MRDQHLLEARLGRAPVQAEGAVALRQGRGGEGAEQVGGVTVVSFGWRLSSAVLFGSWVFLARLF
jgi:hypothetical protein